MKMKSFSLLFLLMTIFLVNVSHGRETLTVTDARESSSPRESKDIVVRDNREQTTSPEASSDPNQDNRTGPRVVDNPRVHPSSTPIVTPRLARARTNRAHDHGEHHGDQQSGPKNKNHPIIDDPNNGGNAYYEHRIRRVKTNSTENATALALPEKSSMQIEIYRVTLFNESITQRMENIRKFYCNRSVTEEKLARLEECQPKTAKWAQACYNEVYGDNWSWTDKRNLICYHKNLFYYRWRSCFFRQLNEVSRSQKEEKKFIRMLREEQPIIGSSVTFFKYYDHIRNERLELLMCQERALGIQTNENRAENE